MLSPYIMLLRPILGALILNLVICKDRCLIVRSPLDMNTTSLHAPVGHQITIQCPAYIEAAEQIITDSTEYTVRWYKINDDGMEELGTQGFHKHFPMYRALPEARLHIIGLQKQLHEAVYHCEVERGTCSKREARIQLSLIDCNDTRSYEFCLHGDCMMTHLNPGFSTMSCLCFPSYSGIHCSYKRTLLFENWHLTWYPFLFALVVFLMGIPVMNIIAAIKRRNWDRSLAMAVKEKARLFSHVYKNVRIR